MGTHALTTCMHKHIHMCACMHSHACLHNTRKDRVKFRKLGMTLPEDPVKPPTSKYCRNHDTMETIITCTGTETFKVNILKIT